MHQDLKPGNILMMDGKFKLADFGLSILYKDTIINSRQR